MSNPPIIAPKKLIEVALPLDAINKACAREKSIRHGHPSTLHLWWARRPLAAARAVLFAQLVNDPSWKYSDEELKKNQVKGSITKKRNELFKLITELVLWENTTKEKVLGRARKEIRSSWKETCDANKDHPDARTLFNPEKLPVFHDPFAGGGAIPLEAQRLGLDAHASDLNPIAVLINKAMIEIPPKFADAPPVGPIPKSEKQTSAKEADDWSGAKGLAEDLRRYGAWVRQEMFLRVGHLYPTVKITKEIVRRRPDLKKYDGQDLTAIAWLRARTVSSPNPAARGAVIPLASGFELLTRGDEYIWAKPFVDGSHMTFRIELERPTDPHEAKLAANGTKSGKAQDFICLVSGTPVAREYIREEGKAGRMGSCLLAAVLEGSRGRVYLDSTFVEVPDLSEYEKAAVAAARASMLSGPTPTRAMVTGGVCSAYGLTTWGHLFTDRQLIFLLSLVDLVPQVYEKCLADARAAGRADADEYAQALALYFSLVASRTTAFHNTLGRWRAGEGKTAPAFGRQAFPMVWDFPEVNPFAGAGGDLDGVIGSLVHAVTLLPAPAHATGTATQRDAWRDAPMKPDAIVSTDPPYYDNIAYADLSDFFYPWVRRAYSRFEKSLFGTIATPKDGELVATTYRHGSKENAERFFMDGMSAAISNIALQSARSGVATIYYAFKQSEQSEAGTASKGWETFLEAVLSSGFGITATWPLRTENATRLVGMGANVLASSVLLACRLRPKNASVLSRRDFLRELEREIPRAIAEMTSDPTAAVAPVDLAQATIGPGMAIFSKYQAVLEADGEPMSVHNALIHINKAVDSYFGHADDELDSDTRFCVEWFGIFGFAEGPFGQADGIARAKGTAVDGVREAGVLCSAKSKVRLLCVREYPKKWDPTRDDRVPIWEACHQTCRALGESEHEAGALLARMPQKQDAIRQLAYRLYAICDRQKWAEEARLYNELITSWPAIVEESHRVGHKGTQLQLI